jgi:hypothetical protein
MLEALDRQQLALMRRDDSALRHQHCLQRVAKSTVRARSTSCNKRFRRGAENYAFGLNRLLPIHSHLNLNSVSKFTFNTNLSDPIPRSWRKTAPRARIPLRAAAHFLSKSEGWCEPKTLMRP